MGPWPPGPSNRHPHVFVRSLGCDLCLEWTEPLAPQKSCLLGEKWKVISLVFNYRSLQVVCFGSWFCDNFLTPSFFYIFSSTVLPHATSFCSSPSHTHSLSPPSPPLSVCMCVCLSFPLSVFVCFSFSCDCHGPFHRLSLVLEAIMGIRRAEGQPGGVRVPEPPCVFLPWVADLRCSSSCCCFWLLPPPPPPPRQSRRETRLVVQREGAGTSGREREQPGEGVGGGGSGQRRPTGAVLVPAEREKVSQCVQTKSFRFNAHSLPPLNPPPQSCCLRRVF